MGPRGPLSVRIHDGVTDHTVTRHVSGVKWTKVSNGGHRAASMRVNLPADAFPDLTPSDRLWIDDTRTGANLFSAYTQNPTPVTGPTGQGFDLSVLGGVILAADETRPLTYVDRDLTRWETDPVSLPSSSIEVSRSARFPGYPRVRNIFETGNVVGQGAVAAAGYYELERAGFDLGGIRVGAYYGGKVDGDYQAQIVTPAGAVSDSDLTVTEQVFEGLLVWPPGTRRVAVQLLRSGGATNVVDEDLTWVDWVDISVVGHRLDRFGVATTAAAMRSAADVRASEVVEDLLGRLLRAVDPYRARVVPTTMPINQLTFPEPTSAQRVLDELGGYESTYRWGIGSDDGVPLADGGRGHDFWYEPLSPEPRYEITDADSYRQTGSETDLRNRIVVHWTDAAGGAQTTEIQVGSDQYPALRDLERAGRICDADPETLPEGKGSLANALVIGHQILSEKATPPRSATATVSRYVRDLWTGALVHPCEMEPGCLVHVRSTGDLIECTELEHDDEAAATTLTLGDPIPDDEKRFARLNVA